MIKTFLSPKGHQNPIDGSKVTVILLKGWNLLVGGAPAVEGLRSTRLPRIQKYERVGVTPSDTRYSSFYLAHFLKTAFQAITVKQGQMDTFHRAKLQY